MPEERTYFYDRESRWLAEWGHLVPPPLDWRGVGDGLDYSDGEEGPGND